MTRRWRGAEPPWPPITVPTAPDPVPAFATRRYRGVRPVPRPPRGRTAPPPVIPAFSVSPNSVIWAQGTYVLQLAGAGTNWQQPGTSITASLFGPTLGSSSFAINSPTSVTWTFAFNGTPTAGTIQISDGNITVIVPVTIPAPVQNPHRSQPRIYPTPRRGRRADPPWFQSPPPATPSIVLSSGHRRDWRYLYARRGRLAAPAALSSFIFFPSLLNWSPPNTSGFGAFVVVLQGTGTQWGQFTPWTITESGVGLAFSEIFTQNATTAVWALSPTSYPGSFTVSDGMTSSTLFVGAPAFLAWSLRREQVRQWPRHPRARKSDPPWFQADPSTNQPVFIPPYRQARRHYPYARRGRVVQLAVPSARPPDFFLATATARRRHYPYMKRGRLVVPGWGQAAQNTTRQQNWVYWLGGAWTG